MKRKAYSKSILREIKSSKARFISILVIILLGVAFYSGIKASGPNMKAAIENFYNEYHLMDAKIVSSAGLSEEDLKLLDNSDKILDYYASHTVDANLTNINSVVFITCYNVGFSSYKAYFLPIFQQCPSNFSHFITSIPVGCVHACSFKQGAIVQLCALAPVQVNVI